MARLQQQLASHAVLGLDTSIFIYHFEAHSDYLPLTTTILNEVQTGRYQGLTSTVTIMEITVRPWRLNRPEIARQYEVLLANFPNLKVLEVTRDIARQAARLRTDHNLRPADALQLGTALTHGATVWISNDKKLRRLAPVLDVVILHDYLEYES